MIGLQAEMEQRIAARHTLERVSMMQKRDVGYLIKNISDKLKVKADAELKQYNLTLTQSRVFAYLGRRGGQATQKEIEVFLEVSHPTVVGIVSRMEQNGYVTSWPSEDGRNKNVKLTSQAEAIGTEMEQRIFAKEQALLAPLSLEDQERLREMLLAIWKNLDGIEAER